MTGHDTTTAGPLQGIKVLDVSALGPGPFCSMLLADYGADVISVVRPVGEPFDPAPLFSRGKRTIVVDLRADGGSELIRRLAGSVDVFLEGYRPGTMERRGLGPETLLADNPALVYARLTGFGQSGPYASMAGHDINYISIGGPLGAIGTTEPVPPLNIVGDFGGGSMNAAMGIVLALMERTRTGVGRVVDAAMVDGAALLVTAQLANQAQGTWEGLGRSALSGNAPYYCVYECADGKWMAVGAIEARFYAQLLQLLGIDADSVPDRDNPENWPALRKQLAATFAAAPREHWVEVFAGSDACATPVLAIGELADNPHLKERGTVLSHDGIIQAAPAPRFGSAQTSPAPLPVHSRPAGPCTRDVLVEYGLSEDELTDYARRGALPDLVH